MNKNAPQKLRVLIIVNRLYEWSQNFITRELVELNRQGVEVYIGAREMVKRDDLTEEEINLQDNFILLPENPFSPSCLWRHFRFKTEYPKIYFRVWKHFFSFGHKRPSKIGRSLVCLFRAASIAEIIIKKRINLIHAHFMTAPAETALYLSILTEIPFGCTSHAYDIYRDKSGMLKKLKQTAYMITETKANIDFFVETWQADTSKIHQIYNSLPLTTSNNHVKKRHTPFTFIAVGRLVPKKGFEYLIKACQHLKMQGYEFRCKIIGQGVLREKLASIARTLAVTDVVDFEGYVPPNKMHEVYEDGDVLVMPSIIESNGDRDGLPTVCMEALSHGLPLVCSEVSGLPECIVEDKNGKIVPQKHSQALAKAMAEIMHATNFDSLREYSVKIAALKFDSQKNVPRIKVIMKRHAKTLIRLKP